MTIDRKPVYGPDDLAAFDPAAQLGGPGEFPFTRGIHRTMYRGRLWTMRQFAGFGTAEDTNRRYKFLLEHGQTGLSVAFDFPTLIAHAAKTRPLGAGTIIGSGTVSNKDEAGGPGKPIDQGGLGYSCLAELRTVETILQGEARTPFMRFGDTIRIEMKDKHGHSIFGAIEQTVEGYRQEG